MSKNFIITAYINDEMQTPQLADDVPEIYLKVNVIAETFQTNADVVTVHDIRREMAQIVGISGWDVQGANSTMHDIDDLIFAEISRFERKQKLTA